MAIPRQHFDRTTFETPRVSEYFNARELTMLTGQPQRSFAAVLQKEIGDNALDAAESANVAPELAFEIQTVGELLTISVADNGPGIPADLIEKVLDFSSRVSDKAAYRSPTRGAQGNALKTVVGIPHALGGQAPITIEASGIHHQIRAWLDPANELRIEHNKCDCSRTVGSRVSVPIPAEGQQFDPAWWARAVSLFNPHGLVRIEVFETTPNHAHGGPSPFAEIYKPLVDYPAGWTKWLPTDAIPAHWYDSESMERLIFLHIAKGRRDGERDLPLGSFIRQFRGLASTTKARDIASLFPQIRRLSDFEDHRDVIDHLLEAMREASRPIPAKALGLIGEAQFRSRFAEFYGVERFWYAKYIGEADGLPIVLEVALAHTEAEGHRQYFGLNFSPTFDDPFGGCHLKLADDFAVWGGVTSALDQAHVEDFPHAFALHLTSPAFTFRDRGKSTIAVSEELSRVLSKALWTVLKDAYKAGERRRRARAKADRDEEKLDRSCKVTVKDAVFEVLPEASAQATDQGKYPVSARMLFYSVRQAIQRFTSKELGFNYFSQTLLTEWKEEHGPLEGLYFDPRGVLYEPHSGNTVSLGTREVEAYHFPEHGFDKILYVEKKGLMPVFQAAKIGDRFDIAIIAGEGYATEAIRSLFSRARKGRYRLFVLHDADPHGYNIARTLAEETRRMPGYSVEVTDLGLRLEEALSIGLQTEKFIRRKALPQSLDLTDTERRYFEGEFKGHKQWECDRVELNAFTSPALIGFVERKLKEAGAASVK